jgi:amino-acid N-acetyltransferase
VELNRRPATPSDWPGVAALLAQCNLPLDGARDHFHNFLVAFTGGDLAGCAGYERYGNAILLRSVAVATPHRGTGLARALVRDLLDNARREGATEVVLLTTTAADYFERFGFGPIARDRVPATLHASAELRGACPQSAVVMRLDLRPSVGVNRP